MNVEIPIRDLQKKVLEKYNEYRWPVPKLVNECKEPNLEKKTGTKSSMKPKVVLNNTQAFISTFIQPEKTNGMLLWHSVGSGKTLSAIAILKQFENKGYNTLFVTRTTLKGDLQKALDMIPLSNKLTVLSYKQFSNIGKSKGNLYNYLLEKAQSLDKTTKDPLYKTIVIIDEVHKLYTKDLKPQEMHDIDSIEKMIHKSYRDSGRNACKVILMSATPITADPMEIISLFNLIIRKPMNRFNLNTFQSVYLKEDGHFSEEGKKSFQDHIKDLVSYIDLSKDPRKFAQVKFTEILVPVSKPENLKLEDNCDQVYNTCVKVLGLKVTECKQDLQKCKQIVRRDKKIYKESKYQTRMLEEKCNVKLK